jgi:hypothetical protein
VWSRMDVVDDGREASHARMHSLTFEDFLEALVRAATMKSLPLDEEIEAAGCSNGGQYLLELQQRPALYKVFLESHRQRWDQEPLQPTWRALDHLLALVVRVIEGSTSKGKMDGKVSKDEALRFHAGQRSKPAGAATARRDGQADDRFAHLKGSRSPSASPPRTPGSAPRTPSSPPERSVRCAAEPVAASGAACTVEHDATGIIARRAGVRVGMPDAAASAPLDSPPLTPHPPPVCAPAAASPRGKSRGASRASRRPAQQAALVAFPRDPPEKVIDPQDSRNWLLPVERRRERTPGAGYHERGAISALDAWAWAHSYRRETRPLSSRGRVNQDAS